MSRLTSFPRPLALDPLKVSPLAFRKLGEHILVTGEGGEYTALSPKDFERFITGAVVKDEALWKDLQGKGFIKDYVDFAAAANKTLEQKLLVWSGPCVHRVAVEGMTLETARAVVDRIFSSRAAGLTLELSGGEPLRNWPVVKFLVAYTRLRAEKSKRTLAITLDAAASLLTKTRLEFLLKNKVTLRFTLDGPQVLHDAYRQRWKGDDFAAVTAGLTAALAATSGEHEGFAPKPRVRVRVARKSLGQEGSTVEMLNRLGVEMMELEWVDPAGRLGKTGEPLATPEEFVEYYRKSFDHIVKTGLKGKKLRESRAQSLVSRILTGAHWTQPEREPLDRVAYDAQGFMSIFDEGQDAFTPELFRVGEAAATPFNEILQGSAHRAGLSATQFEAQPLCSQCTYKPYCTISPAAAVESQGGLWGRMPANDQCRIHMGIFDHLFQRLQEWEVREKLFTAAAR